MTVAELVRRLAAAGASPEVIAIAVEAVEARDRADAERRASRAAARKRQRQSRDNGVHVARHGGDMAATTERHDSDIDATVATNPPLEVSPKDNNQTPILDPTSISEAEASSIGARARPPPAKQATRIPDDFEFDEKTFAVGREEGLTDDAIRREERKFVDWARSAPRERGLKRDWQAAARNWLRKAAESVGSARPPPPGGNGSSAGGLLGAYQRAADRIRAAHDDSERRSDLLDRHRH